MTPFDQPEVEKAVWHIEEDITQNDAYLFADGSALKTFNYETSFQTIVVGDSSSHSYREGTGRQAEFDRITGFAQINITHVLVVDSNNHCIRMVDREMGKTTQFAGTCGLAGYESGNLLDSQFDHPQQIIFNGPTAFITDRDNSAIRQIDFQLGQVGIWKELPQPPTGIVLVKSNSLFYVTTDTQILQINCNSKGIIALTRSTVPGFKDGSFDTALFTKPFSIGVISKSVLLVTEPSSNRLRVLNLLSRTVSSICNGNGDFSEVAVPIDRCEIEQPISMLKLRPTDIIIGTNTSELRLLQYSMGKCKATNSPTSTIKTVATKSN